MLQETIRQLSAQRAAFKQAEMVGHQAFAEKMLETGARVWGKPRHRSAGASLEKRAHGEREARRLRAEGLAAARLTGVDLVRLPGSEARKVAMARGIWEQTIVELKWIAEQLHLRSAANAREE